MIGASLNAHELGAVVASVAAAVETGLVEALAEGPMSEPALAIRAGVDPIALERVVGVLAGAGLVTRASGGVALADGLRGDGDAAPGGLLGIARHYAHTSSFLRTGAPIARMDGATAERGEAYASAVADLGTLFAGAAADLASRLDAPRRVLDVGAGSGVWSLAMLSAAPEARATALDLAPVLPTFVARARALGLEARTSTITGSYHEATLTAGHFDRAVLANVLHLERPEAAASLVARVAAALAPGGEMVVVDVFPVGAHGALSHAAYELHLAMRTHAGRAHGQDAIERWTRAAGLTPVALHVLEGRLRGMAALVARR